MIVATVLLPVLVALVAWAQGQSSSGPVRMATSGIRPLLQQTPRFPPPRSPSPAPAPVPVPAQPRYPPGEPQSAPRPQPQPQNALYPPSNPEPVRYPPAPTNERRPQAYPPADPQPQPYVPRDPQPRYPPGEAPRPQYTPAAEQLNNARYPPDQRPRPPVSPAGNIRDQLRERFLAKLDDEGRDLLQKFDDYLFNNLEEAYYRLSFAFKDAVKRTADKCKCDVGAVETDSTHGHLPAQ